MDPTNVGKPLSFPVPFPEVPVYLVGLKVTRHEARDVLGPPMLTNWVDGLGEADSWAFEFECGLQVAYQFLHEGRGGLVLADSPEVRHVIRHLPFRETDCIAIGADELESELARLVSWYPDRQGEIASLRDYQVWRLDDNGNSFRVGEPTSERDAKCWVKHFESLGHKQTYWYSGRRD